MKINGKTDPLVIEAFIGGAEFIIRGLGKLGDGGAARQAGLAVWGEVDFIKQLKKQLRK